MERGGGGSKGQLSCPVRCINILDTLYVMGTSDPN